MYIRKGIKKSAKQALFVCFCSIVIALVLVGCESGSAGSVNPTPTPISFVPLQLAIPQKALQAPVTGTLPDDQLLHVGITFKIDQRALDQLAQHGVARSGDTATANDVARKVGISDADYQRLRQFFGIKDATLQLSQTRTSMTLDIKAGALAQILQTKFVQHQLDKRTFYTPDPQQMPKLPAPLADRILAVTGLDNYSLAPTKVSRLAQQGLTSKRSAMGNTNCNPGDMVTWKQLAHAYGYDQLYQRGWHGEHMTINLVEIDGANMNDLRTYFNCVGFKGTLDFTTLGGPAPAPGLETMLDIEMIAGLTPAVHIKDYQVDISKQDGVAAWNSISDALQRILDDNAVRSDDGSAVSISLGQTEDSVTGEITKAIGQRLQLLTKAEHMSVYVASGDCGAYESQSLGTPGISYPASDPWAVGVGGTQIALDGRSNRSAEIAWTGVPMSVSCAYNEWGSGGGLSKLFKKPAWQRGPGVNNKDSNGFRQLPDVAAVADNLAIFTDGAWTTSGGTSAATPIWAAGMALVNQGLIATKKLYVYGPDTFYQAQADAGALTPYYDEVVGTNWYYIAGPGWDYTTGLGSPNLPELYQVIARHATV